MIKEILKEKEPIVYLSLQNDLRSNRVSHSYLFYGDLNPLKTEAAFLLAQSIIEGKDDFACEICDTCKRIRALNYFDVIYVDGSKELIKKENIEYIMDEFSRTSLESSNKKIYIINNINNATNKVLNMILKFMEEPSSKDTYGILISDNVESLLPTVVSRCQKIEFKTRDFSDVISKYEEKGFDDIDAYLLTSINHAYLSDLDLNDEVYLSAKEYVYKTIESLKSKDYIPVMFSNEFYTCVSKDLFKDVSTYFLKIMTLMLDDATGGNTSNDDDYNRHLKMLKDDNPLRLLEIFSAALDKSQKPINRNLLFDQIASQIILY